MRSRFRTLAAALGLLLAMSASLAGAAGRTPLVGRDSSQAHPAAAAAACAAMKGQGDARWLTVDESGDATDEAVESYPTGVTAIAAGFDYTCVPKGAVIVTVFSLDGEVVFSNKAPQKPSAKPGSYSFTLSRDDGEAMPDGEWEVSFFNGKTLLSSGKITVGGDASASTAGDEPASDAVQVQGTVTDAKTKKPIKGALVIVLNEGVTAQQFVKDPQDSMVFASAATDARGQFALDKPVEREVAHSWIIAAKGYKPIVRDGLTVGADADDPTELDIALSK